MVAMSGRRVPVVTPGTGRIRDQAGRPVDGHAYCGVGEDFRYVGRGQDARAPRRGPAGEWDAGPVHTEGVGVGLAVSRVVQDG